jgi:hypothetical protein
MRYPMRSRACEAVASPTLAVGFGGAHQHELRTAKFGHQCTVIEVSSLGRLDAARRC